MVKHSVKSNSHKNTASKASKFTHEPVNRCLSKSVINFGKRNKKFKRKKKSDKNVLTLKLFENNNLIEIKRIKLKALKNFYKKPHKKINEMNIDELQEFAHEFDINPDINFKLLLYLQKNKNAEYRN